MSNTDLDFVRDLELELLSSVTRSSRDKLSELLSDDFIEIGKSGTTYNKKNILERLPESPDIDIKITELKQRNLSPECIQNLFVSTEEGVSGFCRIYA
jgi:hypothetical protein